MNYNVNQAFAMFNQDQVRTQTMYEIEFHSGIPTVDATLTKMQVYGQGFLLPDRTVNFEDLTYRAYKIPVPTTLDMAQDHNITIYADVRGDLRRAMLDWQAASINPDITGGSFFESNRRPTRLGDGAGEQPEITVKLLAPDYKTPVEWTRIYGVRVTKVGGLDLSNQNGGLLTFQVDFKSVYWEQTDGTGTPSSMKNATAGISIGSFNKDANRYAHNGTPGSDGDNAQATVDKTGSLARNLK